MDVLFGVGQSLTIMKIPLPITTLLLSPAPSGAVGFGCRKSSGVAERTIRVGLKYFPLDDVQSAPTDRGAALGALSRGGKRERGINGAPCFRGGAVGPHEVRQPKIERFNRGSTNGAKVGFGPRGFRAASSLLLGFSNAADRARRICSCLLRLRCGCVGGALAAAGHNRCEVSG
jgi:hypothetical protein